jgi:hypothetical protein
MSSHPIEQGSQLNQYSFLQPGGYRGPFKKDKTGQEEKYEKVCRFSPINMERISQHTFVHEFAINRLLAVCTSGSIRVNPCYVF